MRYNNDTELIFALEIVPSDPYGDACVQFCSLCIAVVIAQMFSHPCRSAALVFCRYTGMPSLGRQSSYFCVPNTPESQTTDHVQYLSDRGPNVLGQVAA